MKKNVFFVMSIALTLSITSCGGSSSDSSYYNTSSSTSTYDSAPTKQINIGRVHKGMSVNEVKRILGQPDSEQNWSGDVTLFYKTNGQTYQLVFNGSSFDHYNTY